MRLTCRTVLSFAVGIFSRMPGVAHAQIGGSLDKILNGIAKAGGPPQIQAIAGSRMPGSGTAALARVAAAHTSLLAKVFAETVGDE